MDHMVVGGLHVFPWCIVCQRNKQFTTNFCPQRCLEYLRFTKGGGKLSDEEDSWQGCSPILFRWHFDNHLVGDLPSSCHTMWWTHSWVGRLQAIPKKIYMQAINCPKRMVPVLSPGGGTQTNMRTGIASPAFWGSHQWPFTSLDGKNVLITKSCQDGGDTTSSAGRRFGNWTLMYQVPQCREAIWEIEVISKYLSCDSSWQWSSR